MVAGSVEVRSEAQNVRLTANEKAVFQKEDQALEEQTNDDPNFQALKTRRLIFDSSPMDYVAFALERQFDREVILNIDNPAACALNGNYNNKPLDTLLLLIENSLSIRIEQQGNTITFSGDCQ
ncbi:MAG: DUF4974 domain-containing protein [Saprospiraceae bacterium]